jgi:hypothetical protein
MVLSGAAWKQGLVASDAHYFVPVNDACFDQQVPAFGQPCKP